MHASTCGTIDPGSNFWAVESSMLVVDLELDLHP